MLNGIVGYLLRSMTSSSSDFERMFNYFILGLSEVNYLYLRGNLSYKGVSHSMLSKSLENHRQKSSRRQKFR